ncbi:hypothetical protein GM3709_2331 [Geminocystis sp. NIES-3709]|nr:hypothetical protein GM3709_2331 [Geminocystis sp. NIES-3709]
MGTYTPELVKEKIDQLALNDSFDNQYRVDYRIVNHQFIPVFKEQSLPPLKDGEKYQIEVLAGDDKFCYGYEYHLFSHALDAKGYEDFDNNILKFAQFMWGDRVIVLGVTVVKAEVETKKELALA